MGITTATITPEPEQHHAAGKILRGTFGFSRASCYLRSEEEILCKHELPPHTKSNIYECTIIANDMVRARRDRGAVDRLSPTRR